MAQTADIVTSADTRPPQLQPTIPKCDRDCPKNATLAYRWEWGETGVCCAEHAQTLQQTSVSLSRSITVHPLAPVVAAPLLRDERVRLNAEIGVLKEELSEALGAASEMNRRNQDVALQLNTSIVQARELKAQVSDLQIKLDDGERLNARLNTENGALLVELERLRALEVLYNQHQAEHDDDELEHDDDELEHERHVVDG